jgi:hypothetical protein
MPWLKIDSRIYSHPVTARVSPAAMWVWVAAGCWLAQYPAQGNFIPNHALRIFGAKPRYIRELVESGLWIDISTGYEMYPYMDLAGSGLPDPLWDRGQTQKTRRPIPERIRAAVYEQDGYACVECGSDENLSLDHIYPWSLGGSDDPENLQTLCKSCNSSKGARL